jgi:hypothetical protein
MHGPPETRDPAAAVTANGAQLARDDRFGEPITLKPNPAAAARPAPRDHDTDRLQVLLELRHAKIRLELAHNEISWGILSLSAGHINADGGLMVLEDAFHELHREGL